jgi:peptidoglycan/LPS O-acetylase OafA/YrhL
LFLFVIDPLLQFHFGGGFTLLVGMTLEGVSICVITLYVVKRPETVPGRILNTPVLRHIGVISYSLYLWQSIIIVEAGRFFLLALVAILACAEFSYWVVERPSLRLRARLGERRPSVVMKN